MTCLLGLPVSIRFAAATWRRIKAYTSSALAYALSYSVFDCLQGCAHVLWGKDIDNNPVFCFALAIVLILVMVLQSNQLHDASTRCVQGLGLVFQQLRVRRTKCVQDNSRLRSIFSLQLARRA